MIYLFLLKNKRLEVIRNVEGKHCNNRTYWNKKSDIAKVKKIFKSKDNAEAIKKAIDVISGNIELKAIFEKHRGVKIKKVYD